jgi:hypothetical protein
MLSWLIFQPTPNIDPLGEICSTDRAVAMRDGWSNRWTDTGDALESERAAANAPNDRNRGDRAKEASPGT